MTLPSQFLPLVSIIIPTYNHAHYLQDAIESALDQCYPAVEIIVVDDGSTDHSQEIAARFTGRIRYHWQENQGLSAARNTGLRLAKGDYIALLDADDLLEPDYVERMVPVLQAHPHLAGVYCGYQFVDLDNQPLAQTEDRIIPADRLHAALLECNFMVPESMLVRSRCYQEVGIFDESLRACEDWDQWLRITRRHTITGLSDILIRYRVSPGSMSTDPERMLRNGLAVLDKYFTVERAAGQVDGNIENRAVARVYLKAVTDYLQQGDLEKAYDNLASLAQRCPELLQEFSTLFEIGLAGQVRGARGDFSSLDLDLSTSILETLLNRLFADPDLSPLLAGYRKPSLAAAYFTLGRFSYGARRFTQARKFFLRAALQQPHLVLQPELFTKFLKSFLNPRWFEVFSRQRSAVSR